jgi:hypothetical protein
MGDYEAKKIYCSLDNPFTMCRETWCNGLVINYISYETFMSLPKSYRTDEFIPGAIKGNESAINIETRKKLMQNDIKDMP